MHSYFYKLKRNKLLFALSICALVFAILTFSCVIFDIVQLVATAQNSVTLSSAFLPFNIVTIVLDVILLALFVIYFIVKNRIK